MHVRRAFYSAKPAASLRISEATKGQSLLLVFFLVVRAFVLAESPMITLMSKRRLSHPAKLSSDAQAKTPHSHADRAPMPRPSKAWAPWAWGLYDPGFGMLRALGLILRLVLACFAGLDKVRLEPKGSQVGSEVLQVWDSRLPFSPKP